MVFDNTNSNTKKYKGACMTFQLGLCKPIFWLASRHHVLELILNKVFSSLVIEKSKTPEIEVFKTLRYFLSDVL